MDQRVERHCGTGDSLIFSGKEDPCLGPRRKQNSCQMIQAKSMMTGPHTELWASQGTNNNVVAALGSHDLYRS